MSHGHRDTGGYHVTEEGIIAHRRVSLDMHMNLHKLMNTLGCVSFENVLTYLSGIIVTCM